MLNSLGIVGRSGSGFTPFDVVYYLFSASELGTYSDITTYATNYFIDAGITPATIGDPIYQINDQSGNGTNWTQATLADRPLLQQDGDGLYLDFSGGKSLSCTLAAGTYTIVLPTRTGIWINEVVHAGGELFVGGYFGQFDAQIIVPNDTSVGAPLLRDPTLTTTQAAMVEEWFRSRGADSEEYTLPWLLETGAWDDDGYWIDSLNWRDAA